MASPGSPNSLQYGSNGEPFPYLVGTTPSDSLKYQTPGGESYPGVSAVVITCTLSGTIGAATGSFTVVETDTSTLSGTASSPTGSLTAAETITSTLSGTVASPTGSLNAAETITSTLAGSHGFAYRRGDRTWLAQRHRGESDRLVHRR